MDPIVEIILSGLVGLVLGALFQKPLKRRREMFYEWVKLRIRVNVRRLVEKSHWLVRCSALFTVKAIGLFGVLVGIIWAFVPFVWASSIGPAHYSPLVIFMTLLVWYLLLYGIVRVSLRMVRFRFRARQGTTFGRLEFIPATIFKLAN